MNREKEIYKVTLVGSAVNLFLTVFKFLAGILGRSAAMTADAVHSLSDLISDAVVIVFVKVAARPQDDDHDYGHGKYETLATIIVSLLLAGAGVWLMYGSARDIIGHFSGKIIERPTWLALAAALISILLKEGLYHWTIRREKSIHSPALVANAWHHRSDSLTSIAAVIGISGAMFFGPQWRVLDPAAAFVVSFFIIRSAYVISRPAFAELLEKSLPPEEKEEIEKIVLSTPGVLTMHRLRTRHVGMRRAIECHIQLSPTLSLREAHSIASEVEHRLKDRFGSDTHVGIHMEPHHER